MVFIRAPERMGVGEKGKNKVRSLHGRDVRDIIYLLRDIKMTAMCEVDRAHHARKKRAKKTRTSKA